MTLMHGWYILFLLCLAGQLTYVLKRAAFAVRNPATTIRSRTAYVVSNWDVLLFRIIICQFFYWVGVAYPNVLTKVIALAGMNMDMTLPLATAIGAFGFGLASDVLLDWLSQMKQFSFLAAQLPTTGGSEGYTQQSAKATDDKAKEVAAGKDN